MNFQVPQCSTKSGKKAIEGYSLLKKRIVDALDVSGDYLMEGSLEDAGRDPLPPSEKSLSLNGKPPAFSSLH